MHRGRKRSRLKNPKRKEKVEKMTVLSARAQIDGHMVRNDNAIKEIRRLGNPGAYPRPEAEMLYALIVRMKGTKHWEFSRLGEYKTMEDITEILLGAAFEKMAPEIAEIRIEPQESR